MTEPKQQPVIDITEAQLERVLHALTDPKYANSITLADACAWANLSVREFLRCVQKDMWEMRERFAEAQRTLAHMRLDRCYVDINRLEQIDLLAAQRMRIDLTKWMATKVDPLQWGDRKIVNTEEGGQMRSIQVVVVPPTQLIASNEEGGEEP